MKETINWEIPDLGRQFRAVPFPHSMFANCCSWRTCPICGKMTMFAKPRKTMQLALHHCGDTAETVVMIARGLYFGITSQDLRDMRSRKGDPARRQLVLEWEETWPPEWLCCADKSWYYLRRTLNPSLYLPDTTATQKRIFVGQLPVGTSSTKTIS